MPNNNNNNNNTNNINMRIFDKLDILDMRLDSMDKTLTKQEIHLQEHIRRTEALENHLEMIKKDIAPVQKHVNMVEGAFKLLGVISMALGIMGSVLKVIGVI